MKDILNPDQDVIKFHTYSVFSPEDLAKVLPKKKKFNKITLADLFAMLEVRRKKFKKLSALWLMIKHFFF